jgi:glycosyltransferase involved in cell wall biosynthesis
VKTITVVIPATDDPMTLERVVASVKSANETPEEVIVVDRPPNLGPAAARNRGAKNASGDVLVFVDADVEVHEDAFARIRDAFDGDPGLSAVFGSYDDDPDGDGLVSDFRNLLHHHVHHQSPGLATTFWSGLGAIRRTVFLELGGFDERRDRAHFSHASVEDIELGMRLHSRGGRILLDPAIQGKHLKRWTLMSMTETDLLRRGVPWLRLVVSNRSGGAALNLGWSHRVGTAASVVLLVGLLRRNIWLSGGSLAVLLVLERRFYRLLFRRRGLRLAAAGVPLHVVHRLTSAAVVPITLADLLFEARETRKKGGG